MRLEVSIAIKIQVTVFWVVCRAVVW